MDNILIWFLCTGQISFLYEILVSFSFLDFYLLAEISIIFKIPLDYSVHENSFNAGQELSPNRYDGCPDVSYLDNDPLVQDYQPNDQDSLLITDLDGLTVFLCYYHGN